MEDVMKTTVFSVYRDRYGIRFLMFGSRGVSIPDRLSDRMAITTAVHISHDFLDEARLETLLMRAFWVRA